VNEDMIRHYVENQSEDEGEFKVWDLETQPAKKDLEPDDHPVK